MSHELRSVHLLGKKQHIKYAQSLKRKNVFLNIFWLIIFVSYTIF